MNQSLITLQLQYDKKNVAKKYMQTNKQTNKTHTQTKQKKQTKQNTHTNKTHTHTNKTKHTHTKKTKQKQQSTNKTKAHSRLMHSVSALPINPSGHVHPGWWLTMAQCPFRPQVPGVH